MQKPSLCCVPGQDAEPEPQGAEHTGKVHFLTVDASVPKVPKVQKEAALERVLPIRSTVFENVSPGLFPVPPQGTNLPPSQTSFLKWSTPGHCPQLRRPEHRRAENKALLRWYISYVVVDHGLFFLPRDGGDEAHHGVLWSRMSASACPHSLQTRTGDLKGHPQPPLDGFSGWTGHFKGGHKDETRMTRKFKFRHCLGLPGPVVQGLPGRATQCPECPLLSPTPLNSSSSHPG